MHRRDFTRMTLLSLGAAALPHRLFADQACGNAVMTPAGPLQQCTAGIDNIDLQGAFDTQHASEWCWAASISMIFNYYGYPVSQERIVLETWGKIVNQPAQPGQILSDLNRDWTDDNGNPFTSRGDSLSANNATGVVDLRNNDPLIVGALGHAMVLVGLTSVINLANNAWQVTEATVLDPWPANPSERNLLLTEWMNISFAARIRIL